jgi:hypothetical protein
MEDGQQPLLAEATSSTLESPQALPDNEQNRNAGTVSAAAFQNLNRTVAHISEGGLTLGANPRHHQTRRFSERDHVHPIQTRD